MRKNDISRPHNWCVVQAQLDEKEAEYFQRIMRVSGMNTTETLKSLLYPALRACIEQLDKAEKTVLTAFLELKEEGKI